MMTDPIADMLTRIRNALQARHSKVSIPASNTKQEIARILEDEGFVHSYRFMEEGPQGLIELELKYVDDEQSVISGLERVSKPGRRVYRKKDRIPKVMNGLGVAIMSTSRGVLTDRQAREQGVGGEVLVNVW